MDMAIFNALSTEDKNKMYDYIYLYGSRDNCVQPTAKLETIMRFWDEAKSEYLYKLLGEQFILTKKITFEKAEEEIANLIRDEIVGSWGHVPATYKPFIDAWHELALNLSDQAENHEIHWAMQDLISGNALASNRYRGQSIEIPLPNDKKYRLINGAKASKAIGKIALAYGLPKYEEFRIAHSQVLNEKSVSGELCLSIHPLDYMTMSDNDCGWSSCMSWQDHGDFRQGTVEMMNSPMVIMAYLKSSTDFALSSKDNEYWNSKRWRELFVVTPEVVAGIKGYPYWNESLEKAALIWIKELIEASGLDGFGPYDNDIYTYLGHSHYIEVGEDSIPLSFRTRLMYNDFYDTHKIIICSDHSRIPDHIHYSGESECLSCGGVLVDWDSESDLFCSQCDPIYRCCECGDWHNLDELIEVDGALYCSYCYDDNVMECADCGEPHDYRNMTAIHLAKDIDHIFIDKEIFLDDGCLYYGERFFSEEDVHHQRQHWGGQIYFVYVEDLTVEGIRAFGFDSTKEAFAYNSDSVYDNLMF